MNLDVVMKVFAYAVLPGVMAWVGNHLATRVVQESRKRKMYKAAFTSLFVIFVVLTWIVIEV